MKVKFTEIILKALDKPQTTYSVCDKAVILLGLPDSSNGCPEFYRKVLGALNHLVKTGKVRKASVWLGKAWGKSWEKI